MGGFGMTGKHLAGRFMVNKCYVLVRMRYGRSRAVTHVVIQQATFGYVEVSFFIVWLMEVFITQYRCVRQYAAGLHDATKCVYNRYLFIHLRNVCDIIESFDQQWNHWHRRESTIQIAKDKFRSVFIRKTYEPMRIAPFIFDTNIF